MVPRLVRLPKWRGISPESLHVILTPFSVILSTSVLLSVNLALVPAFAGITWVISYVPDTLFAYLLTAIY